MLLYIENRCVKSIYFSHIEPTHFKLIHLLYCMLGTTHVIDEKDIETVRDDMKRLCWHAIYLRWFEFICVCVRLCTYILPQEHEIGY